MGVYSLWRNRAKDDTDGNWYDWLSQGDLPDTAGVGKPGPGGIVADSFSTIDEPRSGIVNVADYGIIGDGVTDDYASLQCAIDDMPAMGGVLVIPPVTDNIRIENMIDFTAKDSFTILGNRSEIKGNGGSGAFANHPLVNMTGCSDVYVRGLYLNTTGFVDVKRPQCALAIGRPVPAVAAGSRMTFVACHFTGKYEVGTLYRSGAELAAFYRTRFVNINNVPAFYDDSMDHWDVCGHQGVNSSNTEILFSKCGFNSYIGDAAGQIIWLAGGNRDINFQSCYSTFSAGSGGRGYVIRVGQDTGAPDGGSAGNCERIHVDDFRCECNTDQLSQANSRFLFSDNPNVISGLYIRDLYFPVSGNLIEQHEHPFYILEWNAGGLTKGDIEIPNKESAYKVLFAIAADITESHIVVPEAKDIDIHAGATLTNCDLGTVGACENFIATNVLFNPWTVEGNRECPIYLRGTTAGAAGWVTVLTLELDDDTAYHFFARMLMADTSFGMAQNSFFKTVQAFRWMGNGASITGTEQDLFTPQGSGTLQFRITTNANTLIFQIDDNEDPCAWSLRVQYDKLSYTGDLYIIA